MFPKCLPQQHLIDHLDIFLLVHAGQVEYAYS